MPRKPYSPSLHGEGWGLGIDSVTARPELLQLIGQCVTMWPFIEHDLAVCLALLLGANTDAAVAVFTALRSSRVQQGAIKSAAEAVLVQDDYRLLRACLKVIETSEKHRNDVVHGQWGVLWNSSDQLVWVESKHHAPHNAKGLLDPEYISANQHRPLEAKMFIYDKTDLSEVVDLLHTTRHVSFTLLVFLRSRLDSLDQNVEARKLLHQMPLVEKALARLDKGQNAP